MRCDGTKASFSASGVLGWMVGVDNTIEFSRHPDDKVCVWWPRTWCEHEAQSKATGNSNLSVKGEE